MPTGKSDNSCIIRFKKLQLRHNHGPDYGDYGATFSQNELSEERIQLATPTNAAGTRDGTASKTKPLETIWIPLNVEKVNKLTNHKFGDQAYKDALLRPTKYIVVPSPDCRRMQIFVLVFTAANDFESRDTWRRIYGGRSMRRKFSYCVIFPIGRLENSNDTARLLEESNLFDDILQGDYVDSYRNLPMKTLSALRFAAVAYPSLDSILKIDDDTAWNVPVVTRYMIRVLPKSISYVTYDEYKDDSYPQYCLGIAYVLHKTALLPMLDAVPEMKYFWIDDVFVTGFMARAANVSFVEINQFVERKPARKDFPDRIFYNDMMFYGTTKENIGRQFIDRTKYALQFN
ncbi:N-acetyllactosaminide 3-alpha-galactosyltransferase [Necator americanus]|uniref:Hexosyltransferase n=1 Tax=Necator americanus TaxID=51031 RepID=W2SLR9_NECAM|nr:N-acetyllactosaminide 3-alpha-galactosyltransferase [Necator americanus]ETN69786.1 N-acetyllactosaminide 3-alpha-galactosyltransferase [Necator americanus]